MTAARAGTYAIAIAASVVGGALASAAGLPLPWLLGGLAVTAAAAIAGIRPFGEVIGLPVILRPFVVPVIGVAIGAAVTPDIVTQAARWWPSILALLAYIPLAHVIGYRIARRSGALDGPSAFFATMPGGFIEATMMAEDAGADVALTSIMQFLRLILCIVLIPIFFSLQTGIAVGSAGGMVLGSGPFGPVDWLLTAIAAAVGALGGRAIGLPAWMITGPVLVSGAMHLAGWVGGAPPAWIINATQLLLGILLGQRFAGRSLGVLWTGTRIALLTVAATLLLSVVFAAVLHALVGETWPAVFLAFAPGGLTEMSLVALSLDISVIYVTAHHVLRIVLAVTVARIAYRRLFGEPPPDRPDRSHPG